MSATAKRDVFQAIADPTRRQIIGLISKESLNLNAIAERFDISRPAVSQHVKILKECGVLEVEKVGREHYCKIRSANLKEVADWVEQYRKLWEEKLDSFENYLAELQTKTKKDG